MPIQREKQMWMAKGHGNMTSLKMSMGELKSTKRRDHLRHDSVSLLIPWTTSGTYKWWPEAAASEVFLIAF